MNVGGKQDPRRRPGARSDTQYRFQRTNWDIAFKAAPSSTAAVRLISPNLTALTCPSANATVVVAVCRYATRLRSIGRACPWFGQGVLRGAAEIFQEFAALHHRVARSGRIRNGLVFVT